MPRRNRFRMKRPFVDSIINSFKEQMTLLWKPGRFERGGNTKTHGIVRGEFIVHDSLPAEATSRHLCPAVHLPRMGPLFRPRPLHHTGHRRCWLYEHQHQAYARARAEADGGGEIHAGYVRRLHANLCNAGSFCQRAAADRERQECTDLLFPQSASVTTYLDLIMQSLWIKTQSSPFEAPYFSCVPYLLGEGQAMQYSVGRSRSAARRYPASLFGLPTTIFATPWSPPLQQKMSNSIFVCSCKRIRTSCLLRITQCSGQRNSLRGFRRPRCASTTKVRFSGAVGFCQALSYNPWHCIAEHRPLGNQNRARRRMYQTLSG